MASISANGSRGHHKFTLTVTETSSSVENNTSTISFSFKLSPITKGYNWKDWTDASRTVSYTVNVNGTAYTGTIPNYDGSSILTVPLERDTQDVTHNTDGTKTISFYFSVTDTANGYNPQTGKYYTPGNASVNGTLALTSFEIEKPSTGAAPIIYPNVEDINDATLGLTGNSSKLIRYHSTAYATMDVYPQHGAKIDEDYLIIRNGSQTGYGDVVAFDNVESNVFTFSAEDDRGYVGTKTVTVNMVNYVPLTCTMANCNPDANGDMRLSCFGNFFNGSFGKEYNELTVSYEYYGGGDSGEGKMTVSTSGNTYSAYADLSELDYQTSYTFTIKAKDKLEKVETTNSGVKSKPVFHWGKNDFAFEVPVNFNSTEEMRFKSNLRLKGDKNFGNTLYFGDGSYCYITEATNNNMTIKASGLNLDTSNLSIQGRAVCGTWTPKLNVSASYTAEGWYQRLGNVVTIGWYIEGYIDSVHNNTSLEISGSPAFPAVNAFGGGLAYNVYLAAGHAFECWCIDSDNNLITARTQPCNGTSAGNLNIGSTCKYPSGGGTIKLSGTICYMTNL